MHVIKGVGAVIEAIVGLLGFRPVESLVLVALQGNVVGAVLRMDLADAAQDGGAEELADLAARSGADGAVAVFVSAESVHCALCAEEFREQARVLGAAVERRGVRLLAAAVVDSVEAGGRWHCADGCGESGVLDDPTASPVAAAAVLAGQRQYGSREELVGSVAADAARVAALAPLLAGVGGNVEDVAAAVREAVAVVRRVGEGAVLSDAELAGVGAVLVDLRVRDALFTLVEADEAAAAEILWSQLCRVLPQPFRVEALVLAAWASYYTGAGPRAGVCLDAALAEVPRHRMARLLDEALRAGIRPAALRALISNVPPAVSV